MAKIQVSFQVDADGLLNVSAKELTSNTESRIEVKPSYGLNDKDIARMLQESYGNAKEDMLARALREQQVDARRMHEDLFVALKNNGRELLSDTEYSCLELTLRDLDKICDSQSYRDISHQIEAASKASEEFAARRMNVSIKKALAGHSLDDIERGA